MAQPATPANVIREVLARERGRPVRGKEKLGDEARGIQLTGDVTVADPIAILKDRAAARESPVGARA